MSLKTIILLAGIVGVVVWYSGKKNEAGTVLFNEPAALIKQSHAAPQFTCEGKTRCTQMTSCEEATFYINNCPGTEMDGDGDGIPCESQWCSL